jgi:alkanesulfonate monooxygenase SsuD/methylene tetrahydromethanopterin reductase-like flavin-dependent oxidoreductase (luciferase family)
VTKAPSNHVRFGLGALSAQTLSGTGKEFNDALSLVIETCQAADQHGLNSVWLSEHHFANDCYLPSPLVVLTALARETDRVTLSTNVAIGPLYHPIRLAEDCAVIDHLSGGRLMLGLGLGYRDVEFAALGFRRTDRARRLEESVGILRRAWGGEQIANVRVTPPPSRPGGPPVLIGAFAEAGIRRAARIADGWIAPELAKVAHLEKRYGQLCNEGPRPEVFHIVLTMSGFVAAHDAFERVRCGADHVESQYRSWLQNSGDTTVPAEASGPVGGRPPYFIGGTPDECAKQLIPWFEFLANLPASFIPHITMRLVYPGVSRRDTLEAVRLFATEVIPRLTGHSQQLP